MIPVWPDPHGRQFFDTARKLAVISLRNPAANSAISVITSLSPSRETISRRPEAGDACRFRRSALFRGNTPLALKQTSRISP
jgi:hypothetical protein